MRFATMVYKKPDLVFDVNWDGIVSTADLSAIYSSVGQFPVQFGSDINGDGVVDSRDAALMQRRLAMGPVVLIPGDVNRDGCVTPVDLALVQGAQGTMTSWWMYDPDLDVSQNGYIGPEDLSVVNGNIGRCR